MTLRRFMNIMYYGGERPKSCPEYRWNALLRWHALHGHHYGPDGIDPQESAERHRSFESGEKTRREIRTERLQGAAT
jgi:hypothetical protein